GWGQWNRLKGEYGVEFRVLLDPHNGYLWALAEGGILGMVVIYLVLLAVLASLRPSMPAFAVLLALVLELSNANLQKPLFAVLVGVLMALAWHASRRPAQQPAPGTPGGSAPEVPIDGSHHPTDVLL